MPDLNQPLDPSQTVQTLATPSFGQAFEGTWDALNRNRGVDAQWRNQSDYLQDQLDQYRVKTGERLDNPLTIPGGHDLVEGYQQKFDKAGMAWPTDDAIVAGGIAKAAAAGRQDWLNSQGSGFAGWAGRMAGQLAYGATDPINAASLALAPEGGLLLRAAGIGAGLAGSAEATNALTYGYQKQVNPSLTPGQAFVTEPLEAGVAGAGGELGFRALGAAWRAMRGTSAAAIAPLPLQDAGRVAEKAADLSAQAPFKGSDAAAAHAGAIKETESAIIDNRPPQLPLGAQAQADARRGTVFFPGGKVDARYELAEAGDLVASHDVDGRINPAYPAELQPRDRSSAASQLQVDAIASHFEPERMAPNSDANMGPPIVGPDNVVESGNGRTAAIRQIYEANPDRAAAYRGWLENQGYDSTGMKQPMLIARRLDNMTADQRANFAQSLTGSGLRLGATEQAMSDARHMTSNAMELAQPGDVDSAGNRNFVHSILAIMPEAEHGQMLTKDGALSALGKRRLDAALTARAYGDQGVVERLYEHPDPNIKTLGHGLREAAIPWAQMRDAAARGEIAGGHDITDALMSAVRNVMRARDTGRPLWEIMHQGNLFTSDLSQLAARLLFKDEGLSKLLSQKDIADNLRTYAEEALKNTSGPRLIGEAMRPEDVLRASRGAMDPHTAQLIDLATEREAREKPMPGEAEAAGAELSRMRERGDNLVFEKDGEGNVVSSVIDKGMAALDAMTSAAKEIGACAIGAAE